MTGKVRLGRGLDALLGGGGDAATATLPETARVAVGDIQQNPFQPRRTFDGDELASLTESVKQFGVMNPVLVRAAETGYQLIAGERRWRAAQAAGLSEIPVHVVDFDDRKIFEAALVENIQRSDLNPIEKAQGFKDYLERFSMTHEALAERLSLDRTTITNLLGLLNLPPEVQDWVRAGQLTMGHAKVLKGLPGADLQSQMAREAIARSLSVHALEQLSKEKKAEAAGKDVPAPKEPAAVEKTAHVQAIEDELRTRLAVRVQIRLKSRDRGQVVMQFESNDDFERIVEQFRLRG